MGKINPSRASGQHFVLRPLVALRLAMLWVAVALASSPVLALQEDQPPEKAEEKIPVEQQVAELDQQAAKTNDAALSIARELSEVQRQVFDLQLKVKFLNGNLQELHSKHHDQLAQIQKLLTESGQWVSFSQQIAPIFQQHCVACHNIRNPQGRYNMATYANILAEGESGAAIVPGKPDESLLMQMISDHSMPKDADPLTSEQLSLVNQWITAGARLDVDAAADAPLFRIAPPPQFPAAPEHYSSPIPITAVSASHDGAMIATGGYHEVLFWSASEKKLLKRIGNVAQRVHSVLFLPGDKQVVVASGTPGRIGDAKIIELDTGKVAHELLIAQDSVLALALSPDAKHLAVGDTSGAVTLFALDGDQVKQTLQIADHSDWVNSLNWSPDGQFIVTASRDKTSKVFDATSGVSQATFSAHEQNVTSAVFLSNGKEIASIGDDHRCRVWKIDEAKQVHNVKLGKGTAATLLSTNGDLAAVISSDARLRLIDMGEGKVTQEVKLPRNWNGSSVAVGDGNAVLIGNQSGSIVRVALKPDLVVQDEFTPQP